MRTYAIVSIHLMLAGALAACGDSEETADPIVTTQQAAQARFDCVETDMNVGLPLGGPGMDPETKTLVNPQDEYIVSATVLYFPDDNGESREIFNGHLDALNASLAGNEGLVAIGFAGSESCGSARTLAVWRSEEAMYNFVSGTAHVAAMQDTARIMQTGQTTHWTASADEVALTFEEAKVRLDALPIEYAY